MSDTAKADGTHGYYEWQVNTLLLAYDTIDPLGRDDHAGQRARQGEVEAEVRRIALSVIPADYQTDETRELPPEVVIGMTRATLRRAAEVVGLL